MLPWSSHEQPQAIMLIFLSIFMYISDSTEPQSLLSGYHWKDLSLLQNLSTDDADLGQG